MLTGVVKWFNDAKGFGFIEHTSGQDVFVHYSVIEWDGFKTLKDGEQVQYELKEGEKGLHAAVVHRPNAKMSEAEKAMKAAKASKPDALISETLISETLGSQIEVENIQVGEAKDTEPTGIFGKTPKESDTDFPEQ